MYRPDTELQSHDFQAILPAQFDEYVWFDATEAVHPMLATSLAPRGFLAPGLAAIAAHALLFQPLMTAPRSTVVVPGR